MAYLIPSVEWAIKNKKRVVISTNTINLQEQLLNKDIPIAKKVVQGDFRYILEKEGEIIFAIENILILLWEKM